ncbi:MAG: hypothetical protein P8X69_03670 [Maritimibacter sp.]
MKQIILVLALMVAYLFPTDPERAQGTLRGALHQEAVAMLMGDEAMQDAAEPQLLQAAVEDAEGVLKACGLPIAADHWAGDGV